jgi:hypothetical protein
MKSLKMIIGVFLALFTLAGCGDPKLPSAEFVEKLDSWSPIIKLKLKPTGTSTEETWLTPIHVRRLNERRSRDNDSGVIGHNVGMQDADDDKRPLLPRPPTAPLKAGREGMADYELVERLLCNAEGIISREMRS